MLESIEFVYADRSICLIPPPPSYPEPITKDVFQLDKADVKNSNSRYLFEIKPGQGHPQTLLDRTEIF